MVFGLSEIIYTDVENKPDFHPFYRENESGGIMQLELATLEDGPQICLQLYNTLRIGQEIQLIQVISPMWSFFSFTLKITSFLHINMYNRVSREITLIYSIAPFIYLMYEFIHSHSRSGTEVFYCQKGAIGI